MNRKRTIKDLAADKVGKLADYVDLEVVGQSIDEVTNWYQKQLASKPKFKSTLAASRGGGNQFSYDEGGYHKFVEIYDFSQTPDKKNDGFKGIEVDLSRIKSLEIPW